MLYSISRYSLDSYSIDLYTIMFPIFLVVLPATATAVAFSIKNRLRFSLQPTLTLKRYSFYITFPGPLSLFNSLLLLIFFNDDLVSGKGFCYNHLLRRDLFGIIGHL